MCLSVAPYLVFAQARYNAVPHMHGSDQAAPCCRCVPVCPALAGLGLRAGLSQMLRSAQDLLRWLKDGALQGGHLGRAAALR